MEQLASPVVTESGPIGPPEAELTPSKQNLGLPPLKKSSEHRLADQANSGMI
jgi:hypothetical protein